MLKWADCADVADVTIIMTDGQSEDKRDMQLSLAARIKHQGANVTVLGVYDVADTATLVAMASSPNAVIVIEDVRDLEYMVDPLLAASCPKRGRLTVDPLGMTS